MGHRDNNISESELSQYIYFKNLKELILWGKIRYLSLFLSLSWRGANLFCLTASNVHFLSRRNGFLPCHLSPDLSITSQKQYLLSIWFCSDTCLSKNQSMARCFCPMSLCLCKINSLLLFWIHVANLPSRLSSKPSLMLSPHWTCSSLNSFETKGKACMTYTSTPINFFLVISYVYVNMGVLPFYLKGKYSGIVSIFLDSSPKPAYYRVCQPVRNLS